MGAFHEDHHGISFQATIETLLWRSNINDINRHAKLSYLRPAMYMLMTFGALLRIASLNWNTRMYTE